MRVVTQAQMRRIDEYMIGEMKIPGIVLMENAALGVIGRILQVFPKERPAALVFCGSGNNGGDGFAVTRGLLARGFNARAILLGDRDALKGDALTNYEMLDVMDGRVFSVWEKEDLEKVIRDYSDAGIVVDAIFGTGLTRPVSGLQLQAVRAINGMDAYCVSVDIPSGISGDTGVVMGEAVYAEATVTFQYPKAGHFLQPGKEYAGELTVTTIGVDEGCPVFMEADIQAYDSKTPELSIERRRADSNKGDYGRLMIIAGSVGMSGAAVLCTRAAIRTGTGLTTLGSVDYVVSVIQKTVPEATCKILAGEMDTFTRNAMYEADRYMKDKTALAVGPGISENTDTQELVSHMLATHDIPKVFDADALNVISRNTDILFEKTGEVILTPHPKEFSRLTGMPVADILADPIGSVRAFVEQYDVILVLKGSVTVVAAREEGISLIAAGSPGMAKGGSGDVLTGIIASLAAQGKNAYEAAVLGVMIAGMAGEEAARDCGEYSMTATDSIERIGRVMDKLARTETVYKKRPESKPSIQKEEPEKFLREEPWPYEKEDEENEPLELVPDQDPEPETEQEDEPELFLPEEELILARPQKGDSPVRPYRRKIEPK